MSDSVADLEPRSLWKFFSDIMEIPRPSGHEERVSNYVESFAAEHGFEATRDATGNLVVRVPATPGHESSPTIIIQGHLDMVGEKNKDVEHDFESDPIRPRIEGEWVYATGTTLGADNGIGVAAGMAAATDPDVTHGPLELLFTVDEESGLTGAKGLDASLLAGRTMLNLDSEEDGVVYVGCAGGADVHLSFRPATTDPEPGAVPHVVEVTGLRGGHSGLNIHENRGNAIRLLARLLLAAQDDGIGFGLADLHGGDKHNAIPREAEATVFIDGGQTQRFEATVARVLAGFRTELQGVDDGLEIGFRPADGAGTVMTAGDRDRLLRLLVSLPHGVLAMSNDIEGLVETSNNLAAVRNDDGTVLVLTSARSSIMSSLDGVLVGVRGVGELAGVDVELQVGYPGWKPNLDSAVLGVVRDVYTRLWKKPPQVTAIHAGLECGLLGEKVPGLDMVSFGPQIEGAHSPDERVNVPSVARFWDALRDVLARLT